MHSQPTSPGPHQALLRSLLIRGYVVLPALLPMFYLVSLTTGLSSDELILLAKFAPVPLVLLVLLIPMLWGRQKILRAFAPEAPGEPPGARLGRLLELPRRLEVQDLTWSFVGAVVLAVVVCLVFDRSFVRGVATVAIIFLLAVLAASPARMRIERLLLPVVVEEFHRCPTAQLERRSLYWIRQSWHLPLSYAITVLSTLATVAAVLGQHVAEAVAQLEQQADHPDMVPMIERWIHNIVARSAVPLLALGLCLCVITGLTAWLYVRHQRLGAGALVEAVEALASRRPRLPGWVSTDELGDVAFATASAFERLRQLAVGLGRAAVTLRTSARELSESERTQQQTLSHQAVALQQASTTVSQIRTTSMTASARASATLKETEVANEIGRRGERAIEESLARLGEIRRQVSAMISRMHMLDERARQIARITAVVKDLADQSNVLALNAAVEAARSGEHGKGFAVVAREIRTLADQSLQATSQVRRFLDDISHAIREAAVMNEKGSQSVDQSLQQLHASEESIRQITAIVRSSTALVRQISEAVEQQHVGVSHATQAVVELSHTTESNHELLQSSRAVASRVSRTAEEVYELVRSYGWLDDRQEPAK